MLGLLSQPPRRVSPPCALASLLHGLFLLSGLPQAPWFPSASADAYSKRSRDRAGTASGRRAGYSHRSSELTWSCPPTGGLEAKA